MATTTLRIRFERPGTEDCGELVFSGSSEFISHCVAPVSYVTSWLNATYGADPENWTLAGNELVAAWEAVKAGRSFEGQIVTAIIK